VTYREIWEALRDAENKATGQTLMIIQGLRLDLEQAWTDNEEATDTSEGWTFVLDPSLTTGGNK
jgi:hypothetical protein